MRLLKVIMNKQARLSRRADSIPVFDNPLIHVLTIIFVVLLIYSNTFNAPFQLDDSVNIVDNPAIKDYHYFSNPSMIKSTILDDSRKSLYPKN